MYQIFVMGQEFYEPGEILANVQLPEDDLTDAGYLDEDDAARVLRKVAAMPQAKSFEWFELVYPVSQDRPVRKEKWVFDPDTPVGPAHEPRPVIRLEDGRELTRVYDVKKDNVLLIKL